MPQELIEHREHRAVCRGWRPRRKGGLRGFCDIELPSGLVLCDVVVLESDGSRWAAPAGIPQFDAERRQKINPTAGNPDYRPSARFASRAVPERFSQAVI